MVVAEQIGWIEFAKLRKSAAFSRAVAGRFSVWPLGGTGRELTPVALVI